MATPNKKSSKKPNSNLAIQAGPSNPDQELSPYKRFNRLQTLVGWKKANKEPQSVPMSAVGLFDPVEKTPFEPSAPPMYENSNNRQSAIELEADISIILSAEETISNIVGVLPNLSAEFTGKRFMWNLIIDLLAYGLRDHYNDSDYILKESERRFSVHRPIVYLAEEYVFPEPEGDTYMNGFRWMSLSGRYIEIHLKLKYKLCKTMGFKFSVADDPITKDVKEMITRQ